ncbi:helix-turn-helix domain-containing protein [Streptomyces sp. NBC_00378]|uniref:winged helix-turn-helix transcriptional regulator n=1 Tax=Streptomyces sp. NBC_00378 TaxID=2975732 RepID=UPI00338FA495
MQAAAQGARHFGDYRALINGISDRLLSQRLKELEAAGLIERTVIPTTPYRSAISRPRTAGHGWTLCGRSRSGAYDEARAPGALEVSRWDAAREAPAVKRTGHDSGSHTRSPRAPGRGPSPPRVPSSPGDRSRNSVRAG